MKSTLSKLLSSMVLRVGLSLAVSGFGLYLAFLNVNLLRVWTAITEADARYIWLALCSVAINNLGKAFRWQVLIGRKKQEVRFSKIFAALLAGQMLNTLFPVRTGDLGRAYVIGGIGPGRSFVFGTVILEKVIDTIFYALLFVLLLLMIPQPSWLSQSVSGFIIIAFCFSAAVAFVAYRKNWLIQNLSKVLSWLPAQLKWSALSQTILGLSSLEIIKNRVSMLKLVLWSVLIWGTAVLNNHLTLHAFQIQLPLTAPVLILIGLQAGISLPSAPWSIGIFEYICVLALELFGIGQEQALSYGILLHGIVMIPSTLLGLVFFWFFMLARKKESFRDGGI